MTRNAALLVSALVVAALAAGCGGKSSSAPEIVKFDGPDAVSCGTGGKTKTVSFQYETKNTEAVSPEIDGQGVGAQAGYDPDGGTMRFPYVCPGPHTLTISAFGHNQTVTKSARVVPESGGSAGGAPEIVKFEGPDVVPCGKSGETKTVEFEYETKNATAVEPEIDGQPPGAQAGYDPHSGTMRFAYVCPGPHKLTISAFGKNNRSVSDSVTFNKSNRAVSKTSSVDVESSG